MSCDFPEVAERLRQARGFSLRSLARAVPCDPGFLSKVMRGRKPCPEGLAQRLDDLLQADGKVVAAARAPEPLPERDLGGYVAPELVGYFREQLAGHYTADMFLGPRSLIPVVQAQAELIISLAGHARENAVRHGLLDVGTACAACLGWLFQDAGDIAASARWRDVTLDMAHRAGDPDLISYALSNKAMLAADQGNGRTVLDFAEAARGISAGLAARTQVIALQHAAQGHAMLGDRDAAARLIDQAAALIPSVNDDRPWGNACRRTPNWAEAQRATCYGKAGDFAGAARVWDDIMGAMPASARRDNAVFATRQAAALARVPDPDRVVALAAQAADAASSTGSARLRRELAALPAQARSWRNTSAGRQLAGIVAEAVA
jgi:transcriptional regulator with XRE-family HTH domain